MFRNLLVCALAVLSGCVLYVEPYESGSSHSSTSYGGESYGYYKVWFDNIVVDCWHDYYAGSEWYFSVDIDTSYGPGLIETVTVSITTLNNAQYWDYLDPYGYSNWSLAVNRYYFDCHDTYDIVFGAREEDGTSHAAHVTW